MVQQPEAPCERYALIGWYLAFGMALSTREVAAITGLKMNGALLLMYRISRVLPIYQDGKRIWRLCAKNDGPTWRGC